MSRKNVFQRISIPFQDPTVVSIDYHYQSSTTAEFEKIKGTFNLILLRRFRSQEFPQEESRSKWIAKVEVQLDSRHAFLSFELTENPPAPIEGLVVFRIMCGDRIVHTDGLEHMFRNTDPLVMRIKDTLNIFNKTITFEFTLLAKYRDAERIALPINAYNSLENLKDDIFRMYREKKLCDVTINVGDQVYSAHKFILVSRSPVFAAMFEKDEQGSPTDHIAVTDFGPEIVQSFLEFLYSGNINVDSIEMAIGLLRISDKYEVLDIKTKIAKFLMRSVSDDNALSILLNADLYNLDDLKECALKHIRQKPSVLSDENIATLFGKKPELLRRIIRGD